MASALASGGMMSLCLAGDRSEPHQYAVRQWQLDDGLPSNTVNFLLQAQNRYLWIGTVGGLARFDGVHFDVFTSKNTPGVWVERRLTPFTKTKTAPFGLTQRLG